MNHNHRQGSAIEDVDEKAVAFHVARIEGQGMQGNGLILRV